MLHHIADEMLSKTKERVAKLEAVFLTIHKGNFFYQFIDGHKQGEKTMKIISLVVVALLLVFSGCSLAPYFIRYYEPGVLSEATVGSLIMGWENGFGPLEKNVGWYGMRKELLYGGIAQNVVQISYREYAVGETGLYARPSFYQDLKYDLTNSKIITFQDVRIRIESATPEKIVFTIIQEPTQIAQAPKRSIFSRNAETDRLRTMMNKNFTMYDVPVFARVFLMSGDSINTYILGEDNVAYAAQDSLQKSPLYRMMKNTIKYYQKNN